MANDLNLDILTKLKETASQIAMLETRQYHLQEQLHELHDAIKLRIPVSVDHPCRIIRLDSSRYAVNVFANTGSGHGIYGSQVYIIEGETRDDDA